MDKEKLLSGITLFANIQPKHLKGIAQICTERNFKAGDVLIKQGEDGIGLFVLTSGRVKVEKTDPSGKMVEIASNSAGDILGEMAVLDGAPRTATVTATEDTAALVLASWEFNSFLKAHPEVAIDILPIVVKRFRETNDALIGIRM